MFGQRQRRWKSESGPTLKKIAREPSATAPCATLGVVLRETDRYISYRDRHGTHKIISKRWAVHSEPCPSCPDYPEDEVSMANAARATASSTEQSGAVECGRRVKIVLSARGRSSGFRHRSAPCRGRLFDEIQEKSRQLEMAS